MKKPLIIIAFLTGFSSCVVKSPAHSGISTYNTGSSVKMINSPNYKNKITAAGIVFQLGGLAGGAMAGMALEPTTFYGPDNKAASNKVINAVIGGAVGYGITSLMYMMQGQGNKTSIIDEKQFPEWLKTYNRRHPGVNYAFTGFSSYQCYLVLPDNPETERSYTAANVEQAVMFKNAFPYSNRNAAFETKAAGMIRTQSDAALFLEHYPNSAYKNSVSQTLKKMEADVAAAEKARQEAIAKREAEIAAAKKEQEAQMLIATAVTLQVIKKGFEALAQSGSGSSSDDDSKVQERCWQELYPPLDGAYLHYGLTLQRNKVTCIEKDGDTIVHHYYYLTDEINKEAGWMSTDRQGFYEDVLGSDNYLGDEGLEHALRELCDCEK